MYRRAFIMTIAALLAVAAAAPGMAAVRDADSRIDQVTVYPDRAGIVRLVTLDLPAGDHTIVFDNLPMGIDQGSFRSSAAGPQGTMLLGLNHSVEQHLNTPRERVAELEAKILRIERERHQVLTDRLEVLKQQKDLLAAMSREHAGETEREGGIGRLDMDTWAAAYEFLARRMTQVVDSMRIARVEIEDVQKELELLRSQLSRIRGGGTTSTRTAAVDIRLAQAGAVRLELQYTVRGAGWQPLYDARLTDAADSVELGYFAEVTQNTGEDWSDVELTLSTAMPSQGMAPSDFRPFYLSVLTEIYKQGKAAAPAMEFYAGEARAMEADVADGFLEEEASRVAAAVNTTGIATTFTCARRESVPSDGSAVRAPIAQWTFAGELSLLSRPRYTPGVFRRVELTNTADAPIMPGRVAVFAGADFLGNSAIVDFVPAGGSFDLPFGRENELDVERDILAHRDEDGSGWLGLGDNDRRRVVETIEITLTNNGRRDRTLVVEEPFPVSQDERIEVKTKDVSPKADDQDVQGKASWTVSLKPGQKQMIIYTYEIEFPAGIVLSGL